MKGRIIVQLDPCPFCGEGNAYVDSGDLTMVYVRCDDCDAQGPRHDATVVFEPDQGIAGAAKKWNERKK